MTLSIKDGAGATTSLKTNGSGTHVPHHVVDSSALPSGAATSALQDDILTALAAVSTAIGNLLTTAGFQARIPANGQATMSASVPVVVASNQTAIPVSGTVAVGSALPAGNNNVGDVDIASIAAGDNNIGNVDVVSLPALAAGTNNIGDVDVLSVPADPFGANADAASATGSISAKLRFIASTGIPITGTVSLASLPAGTNAIGKLAANSGVDIGDVDVTSLPAIPAGNNNIGDVDIASIAAGDNNIGNVDVVTLPALAAGTNNIGDVDVLTVPADPFGANADAASATGSISAKLRFIAATGIPVTSLPALPAGTNGIGKLTANSGVDIGDVDVTSVPTDPFGANADAASATGSISAKLRFIAATGIPVTSLPTLPAGTNAIGKLAANSGVDIGDVDVTSVSVPSTVYAGQKTVTTAGTEVSLASSQTLTQGVWIKALHANTGFIYVGLNGVTSTTGFVLDNGEAVFVPIANISTVFIDSSVNGEGVSYIGF
jgi:hypothetical protein